MNVFSQNMYQYDVNLLLILTHIIITLNETKWFFAVSKLVVESYANNIFHVFMSAMTVVCKRDIIRNKCIPYNNQPCSPSFMLGSTF